MAGLPLAPLAPLPPVSMALILKVKLNFWRQSVLRGQYSSLFSGSLTLVALLSSLTVHENVHVYRRVLGWALDIEWLLSSAD